MKHPQTRLVAVIAGLLLSGVAAAEVKDALDLSLEELLAAKVTSASRREEAVIDTPAAIYVISREDISRSTARHVMDLLRMVPGIHVAQLDASKFAITSRGFSGLFANKLLVLVDGRTVYSPVYSGVYWSQEMVPVEEIERIEVIRGPGAAMWGSNAVNGVINIITKDTSKKGGQLTAGGGTPNYYSGYASYTGALTEDTATRVWGRMNRIGSSHDADNIPANDDVRMNQGGARFDSILSDQTSVQASVNVYREDRDTTSRGLSPGTLLQIPIRTDDKGEAVAFQSGVTHKSSEDSIWKGNLTFDRVVRSDFGIGTSYTAWEGQLQNDLSLSKSLKLLTGVGARGIHDSFRDGTAVDARVSTDTRDLAIYNGFAQAEYELIPDTLTLTAGSKFEYHTFTQWNVQPNARVSYSPAENQLIWGAFSIARRVPSRFQRDGTIVGLGVGLDPASRLPVRFDLLPNEELDSEQSATTELGYRGLVSEQVTFDLATFYTRYTDLTSYGLVKPIIQQGAGGVFISQGVRQGNDSEADIWGVEPSFVYQPMDWIKLRGSYSLLQYVNRDEREISVTSIDHEGRTPEHMASLLLSTDLTSKVSSDVFLGYGDQLRALDTPSYVRLDLKLAYRVTDDFKISVIGQNLLEKEHTEFGTDFFAIRTAVPRGVFGFVELTF